jgi:hypothetical protein
MGAAESLTPIQHPSHKLGDRKKLVHELDLYYEMEKRLDLLWTLNQTNNLY